MGIEYLSTYLCGTRPYNVRLENSSKMAIAHLPKHVSPIRRIVFPTDSGTLGSPLLSKKVLLPFHLMLPIVPIP